MCAVEGVTHMNRYEIVFLKADRDFRERLVDTRIYRMGFVPHV